MVILEALAIWLVVVLISMLVVAYLAHRWGHDPFGFLFLTAVLGPIAIFALVGTRHREEGLAASAVPSRTGTDRPFVVIACDGSDSGRIAAEYVARNHGENTEIVRTIPASSSERASRSGVSRAGSD